MSGFSTEEKTNLLIKKYFGKPSALNERPFFQEPNRPARPVIIAAQQLWADAPPLTAPASLQALTDSSLDDNGFVMKGSLAGKTDGDIRRYLKVPLTMLIGTDGAAYEAPNSSVSHPGGYADGVTPTNYGATGTFDRVTQDTVPFNYDFLGSYLYNLYRPNDESEISFGTGEWVLDNASGFLTFYEYSDIQSDINESNPPLISFYRYIGTKGIPDNTTNNTFASGIQIDDECPADLATNSFTEAIQFGTDCDGAWRIRIQGGGGDPNKTAMVFERKDSGGTWCIKHKIGTR